jgi:hypothetical protein
MVRNKTKINIMIFSKKLLGKDIISISTATITSRVVRKGIVSPMLDLPHGSAVIPTDYFYTGQPKLAPDVCLQILNFY